MTQFHGDRLIRMSDMPSSAADVGVARLGSPQGVTAR